MQTFEASRPTVGAQALGIARAAYEYALDYAKERKQFGKPIIENQAIAFALADMKMEIDAARLLVWRPAWMGRTGQKFENAEGSMSKLKAGEVIPWSTDGDVQILGGNGYAREFPVERNLRATGRSTRIFEGTSEIQRLVISRAICGVPRQMRPRAGEQGPARGAGPCRLPRRGLPGESRVSPCVRGSRDLLDVLPPLWGVGTT